MYNVKLSHGLNCEKEDELPKVEHGTVFSYL